MVRVARLIATLLLVVATGIATPLTFLWCEDGCDDIRAATSASTQPACHHVTRVDAERLETPPRACGHDHSTFVALRPSIQDDRSSISHHPFDAIVLAAVNDSASSGVSHVTRLPAAQLDTSPHLAAPTVLRI